MNTQLDLRAPRTVRIVGSIIASVLITFTGLNLIANYALPGNPQAGAVQLAAAAAPAPAPAR